MSKFIVLTVFLMFGPFATVFCSVGDLSPKYRQCLNTCINVNCLEGGVRFSSKSRMRQDVWNSLLQWNCRDECSYNCMWRTVKKFEEAGQDPPKFHGKWPFTRMYGVQEPASAYSSILNLVANAYMYQKLRQEFPFRRSALVAFWHMFTFVCINAWVWSTIFHIRDKPFTEFMDYACALSMVMGLFVAAIVRVFHRRRRLVAIAVVSLILYYAGHVQYLYEGRVDYDYNMKVNVFFGVAASVVWLVWWWGSRAGRSLPVFVLWSGAALTLELLDFPPLRGTWDAHALWHLATAPLPLFFFKFVIDDLRALQSGQYEKIDVKST